MASKKPKHESDEIFKRLEAPFHFTVAIDLFLSIFAGQKDHTYS